jgi:prevent-host-death family protein
MKIASIADVKAHFSAHLKELETGPLVITRNGRPAGVLLAVKDEDEIERLILGYTPRLRAILDAAHRRSEPGAGAAGKKSGAQVEGDSVKRKPAGSGPKKRRARKA